MTMHSIEFSYNLPETGVMEIEIDPFLDRAEKKEFARREIEEVFDDIKDLEITKISELN